MMGSTMNFEDLLLLNGEIVRLVYPDQHAEPLLESLSNAIRRGDEWSTMQFDGCIASYMGVNIVRINMKQVIGRLP